MNKRVQGSNSWTDPDSLIKLATLIISVVALGFSIFVWTEQQRITIQLQRLEHFKPWVEISGVGMIKLIGHSIYQKTAFPIEIKVASPHPYRIEVMNQTSFQLYENVRESSWLLREYANKTRVELVKAASLVADEGVNSHALYIPVEALFGVSEDAPPEIVIGDFCLKLMFLDISSNEEKTFDVETKVMWIASLLRDLTVEFFILPETFEEGRTYEITIQVKNIGETDAGAFNVELRANEDIVNKTEIGGLLSGAILTMPLKWTPKGFFPGDYILKIMVDSEDQIDELDETNNIATVEVIVFPRSKYIYWLEDWGPIVAGAVTIVIIVIIAVVITRQRR